MSTALCVFSRLFVWSAVSPKRDAALLTRVMTGVVVGPDCASAWLDGVAGDQSDRWAAVGWRELAP